MPFEVTGFNPPDFHVAQQRFKTNPDHSQVTDIPDVVALLEGPTEYIEVCNHKRKRLAGNHFFLIFPRPPDLDKRFNKNVAEVRESETPVNARKASNEMRNGRHFDGSIQPVDITFNINSSHREGRQAIFGTP